MKFINNKKELKKVIVPFYVEDLDTEYIDNHVLVYDMIIRLCGSYYKFKNNGINLYSVIEENDHITYLLNIGGYSYYFVNNFKGNSYYQKVD
ncbi:MAG: hypothetical protein [Microviridae sp.]|nr:MAG: hypothetical protein [Microviridae sp.]